MGHSGAIILRVILVFFATNLMEIPGLRMIGGILLIWIGVKLLNEVETHNLDGKINQSSNLLTAIRTIIIADFVMSLDNAWLSPQPQKVILALLYLVCFSASRLLFGAAH